MAPLLSRTCRPLPRLFACGAAVALLAASPAAAKPPVETVPRTELSHPCSRAVSRTVRKQLEKEVLRPASRAGLDTWPKGCPLDPVRDLYGRQEKQKQRKRGTGNLWTCGICGKTFKSEHYLDLHMERVHMNETPRDGVCLADYCEVFEVCNTDVKTKRRKDRDAELECDNSTLAKAKTLCETAMLKCFPLQNEASRKMHAKLSRHWCQVLDCRIRAEQRKEHHGDLMPVIVLLILIGLICFIVFSIVVCCVDYSDDILQFLVDSRLASTGFVRNVLQARRKTQQTLGMSPDRTKCI
mmetsp:Transcript_33293/g.70790  ORF Transcript_33293/g.70790 Transcript_33293/m.70790 type:complete len:297 (-) Transcript_33293:41-931(-)